MIDLAKLREDTPGVLDHVHFNNAGSSLPPRPVLDRVIEHLKLEARIGGYEAADVVDEEAQQFYHEAARFIHAQSPHEIAFTQSSTASFHALISAIPLCAKDRVIIFQHEYASNYLTLLHLQKKLGFSLDVIPLDCSGDIDLDVLRQKMHRNVKVVVLDHMPTQSGALSPAEEVGAIVKAFDAVYILDATQTIGQYPVNVHKIGCDALCATSRKFLRGPRGCGFLYVKESLANNLIPAVVDLESAHLVGQGQLCIAPGCKRFETWERSLALQLGLQQALIYAQNVGIDAIWQRGQQLAARMRQGLASIPGVVVHDPGSRLGNIVTFTKSSHTCSEMVRHLAASNIAINMSKKSYAWLDFEQRNLEQVCRASPHYYNSEEEVDIFLDVLKNL